MNDGCRCFICIWACIVLCSAFAHAAPAAPFYACLLSVCLPSSVRLPCIACVVFGYFVAVMSRAASLTIIGVLMGKEKEDILCWYVRTSERPGGTCMVASVAGENPIIPRRTTERFDISCKGLCQSIR
jgi:hypothetical protein